jgi:hypothetical protein
VDTTIPFEASIGCSVAAYLQLDGKVTSTESGAGAVHPQMPRLRPTVLARVRRERVIGRLHDRALRCGASVCIDIRARVYDALPCSGGYA